MGIRSAFLLSFLLLCAPVVSGGDPEFIRGDADQNGSYLSIIDALYVIQYLTGEGDEPLCMDAADANDDGRINIVDILRMLHYSFGDAPEIPEPFPDCGTEDTDDDLDCADAEGCV